MASPPPLFNAETCLADCTHFPECAVTCAEKPFPFPNLLAMVVLVGMSGGFSGLTLGLLSLSLEGLDIVMAGGDAEEKRWAEKIYPVRKRGNHLLCTLLLGNTLVNALIAIISADMTSGVVGGLLSTGIIVIFGEIIPQAICSRHGLRIGAACICVVRPLMILLSPITLPIARGLDYALGREMGMAYNKKQLDKLLEMHTADQTISSDDQKMLSSALTFSEKNAKMIMTRIEDVYMMNITEKLDFEVLKSVYQAGYTRVPIYQNKRDCIVGVLFTKDLILVDPNDEIPVASILPFCSRAVNAAPHGTPLDHMLKEMQSSRSHLYFIVGQAEGEPTHRGFGKKLPQVDGVVGIVTMEDLIEELISKEIIDDFDVVSDNVSRKKVSESRRSDRLEFFDMLQRREILQLGKHGDKHPGSFSAKTADEVRALVSYLSSNVPIFRPASMSSALLRKIVLRSNLIHVTQEDVKWGKFVYVRGVQSPYACLLLHGRLSIKAGNEGFTSEVGPWTPLSLQALLDDKYAPDYTAQCITPARIFFVSRADVQAVLSTAREPLPVGSAALQALSRDNWQLVRDALDDARGSSPCGHVDGPYGCSAPLGLATIASQDSDQPWSDLSDREPSERCADGSSGSPLLRARRRASIGSIPMHRESRGAMRPPPAFESESGAGALPPLARAPASAGSSPRPSRHARSLDGQMSAAMEGEAVRMMMGDAAALEEDDGALRTEL